MEPGRNLKEEVARKGGFIGVSKDDPLWQACYKSVDYVNKCFQRSTRSTPSKTQVDTGQAYAGFSDRPHLGLGGVDLFSTRIALETLWWAQEKLCIDDAIPRFEKNMVKGLI